MLAEPDRSIGSAGMDHLHAPNSRRALSPWCALPTVVHVVGGDARDPEWQPELP